MNFKLIYLNQILVTVSVVFGSIALALACVGIGTPNWQTILSNTTSGQTYISRTANFFYACRLNSNHDVLSCGDRSTNSSILQYYNLYVRGKQSNLNFHLNAAAGLSIIGILFIFLGIVTSLLMFFGNRAEYIFLIAPSFLFAACLFMVGGLAEGSRVLRYNGYSANLFEAAHLFTIFTFLISATVAGRLFRPPPELEQSRKTIRIK